MAINTALANMNADLYIGGKWVIGDAGTIDNIDPGNETTVGTVSLASADQVRQAIAAARDAFPAWSSKLASEQGAIIRKAATLLAERIEEAAATMLLETGKTEADARGEINRSAFNLRWNGEEAERITTTIYPGLAPGSRRFSSPTPLGAVALVSAWNFPAVLTTRKLGAALAAGCTVVFKASELAPATARLIVELFVEAGLPDGVVNLVFGDPPMVSTELTNSEDIKALSFTGSTEVGKVLAAQAAPNLIRTVMELGGHAPVLVMHDADVDFVVNTTAIAKFGSAGQSCVAPSRFFVHESLYPEFVQKMTAKAESLVVGHGTEPDVTMGAVATLQRVDALTALAEDARSKGGRVTTGGGRLSRDGFFFAPTIIADLPLDSDAAILTEEPFGPIGTVSSFSTVDEAIDAANAAPFAFAAYLFTDSTSVRNTVLERLNATNIGVNQLAYAMPDVPMSGMGNSGYGYEGGTEGILAFTQLRLISETPAPAS
ncbi:aldehyde dehydrogenase family protein [Mycolicibacterium goodii]|uniref:aldehyde dehydrogenase family protein n=1 Tax=Mycolicibacterium goodii TaxID=134601 RepID=UPI001BDD785D|nr:aldehyde dehydrogenase family protein [Mycolicibacterium goodii]MBU8828914.1 aldehyde dehydrogenase family protein [Mycolicibacterium goodii]